MLGEAILKTLHDMQVPGVLCHPKPKTRYKWDLSTSGFACKQKGSSADTVYTQNRILLPWLNNQVTPHPPMDNAMAVAFSLVLEDPSTRECPDPRTTEKRTSSELCGLIRQRADIQLEYT